MSVKGSESRVRVRWRVDGRRCEASLQFRQHATRAGGRKMIPKELFSRRSAIVLAIVVLAFALGYVVWGGRRALIVSHEAVMGRIATRWIRDYVAANEGKWPTQWEDLNTIPNAWGNPKVITTIQQRIVVDFKVEPASLATQSVAEFTAIRPRSGYGVDHREYWEVGELLCTLRKYHGAESMPK